jgi:hypothetical protein
MQKHSARVFFACKTKPGFPVLKKPAGFNFAPEAGDGFALIVGLAAGAFVFRP